MGQLGVVAGEEAIVFSDVAINEAWVLSRG